VTSLNPHRILLFFAIANFATAQNPTSETIPTAAAAQRKSELLGSWRIQVRLFYQRLGIKPAAELRDYMHPSLSGIPDTAIQKAFETYRGMDGIGIPGNLSAPLVKLSKGILPQIEGEKEETYAILTPLSYHTLWGNPLVTYKLQPDGQVVSVESYVATRLDLWLYERGKWKVIPQEWLKMNELLQTVNWTEFVKRE
jgi:hypothetical protein